MTDVRASQVSPRYHTAKIHVAASLEMWRNSKCLRWEPFWLYCASSKAVFRPKEVKVIILSCKSMGVSVGDDSWYPLVFITVPKDYST